MSFSLIKQPLKLAFTETMHQLPCFSNNIRLRIGMMDPLYMYLPAAYEHLRSQERKQKIREIEVKESRVADDPKNKKKKNYVQRACRTRTKLSTGLGLGP